MIEYWVFPSAGTSGFWTNLDQFIRNYIVRVKSNTFMVSWAYSQSNNECLMTIIKCRLRGIFKCLPCGLILPWQFSVHLLTRHTRNRIMRVFVRRSNGDEASAEVEREISCSIYFLKHSRRICGLYATYACCLPDRSDWNFMM